VSNLLNHGIVEVATLTPTSIEMANPSYNVDKMLELIHVVNKNNQKGDRHTRVVVYPELSMTGYNCGELFNQSILLDNALKELKRFVIQSDDEYNPLIIVGAPIRKDNQLFNCAVIIYRGKILGIVPKTYLPNYTVLYEARYFHSAINRLDDEIELNGERIPFTPNLLFEDKMSGAVVSAELCEDLWMPLPPSAYHCLHGANIVGNLSSSNQVFGKTKYREDLLKIHSSISVCGYIYTCATYEESTTDSVFAGHNIIADNGIITGETKFMENKSITYGEIDIENIINARIKSNTYMAVPDRQKYIKVQYETFTPKSRKFMSNVKRNLLPFVPNDIVDGYKDVFDLQMSGLAQRLKKNNCNQVILEMSDSINSILALIVTYEAFKWNGYDSKGILCTFTSDSYVNLNRDLLEQLTVGLEVTLLNEKNDKYYNGTIDENIMILGDDDLTELAVGKKNNTTSYNYAYEVNSSIPKTVIPSLINNYENLLLTNKKELNDLLIDSNESIMVYDFILYYMLNHGFGPKKIFDIYLNTWRQFTKKIEGDDLQSETRVLNHMKSFYSKFFDTQFDRKRPDSIKVFSASLSQNDWRMPSDASSKLWLKELDEILLTLANNIE
jgi:NAD+ synthase (glutamine-hydrolysing)